MRRRLAILLLAWSSAALAVDLEPHLKTKLCGGDEASCADVSVLSGVKRARVDATVTGAGGTVIGNVGDRLKVDGIVVAVPSSSSFGTVFRQYEANVTTKAKTDLPTTTYTVPAGKTFVLTSIVGNYDTQSPITIRLEKQTGGAGAFVQQIPLKLRQSGNDAGNFQFTVPFGVQLGVAADVLKLTYESSLAKGVVWAAFTGIEY